MTLMRIARAATIAILLALTPVAGAAQPPAAQDGFVPVDQLPSTQEQVPAAPLVGAAYGVAWAVIFGYVWSLWRRLDRVNRELSEVSRRLEPGARR